MLSCSLNFIPSSIVLNPFLSSSVIDNHYEPILALISDRELAYKHMIAITIFIIQTFSGASVNCSSGYSDKSVPERSSIHVEKYAGQNF